MKYRLYTDLAGWWSLMSPPAHYAEEAVLYLQMLRQATDAPIRSLLELGSGAGHLASQLPQELDVVLSDRAEEMLQHSRALNPNRTHVCADMRTLQLDRQFDAILLHDAVMYLTGPDDLQRCLDNMVRHCRPGGAILIVPDVVRESFEEFSTSGGQQGPDGRALNMLEWHWDPDPSDDTYQVDFAFLTREADGSVQCIHEQHTMALFSTAHYTQRIQQAGFELIAAQVITTFDSPVFLARRPH